MPARAGEIDLGVAGRIGGHDSLVVQRPVNRADLSAFLVELRIDDAQEALDVPFKYQDAWRPLGGRSNGSTIPRAARTGRNRLSTRSWRS